MAQAVVCNSGNANTCNADGVEKAEKMCVLAAEALHLKPEDIIVASTGVIGQVLPIEAHRKGHYGTGSHHFQRRQSGCRAGHHDHRHQAQGRGL